MVDAVDFFAGKYLSGAERNLANLASPSGGRFGGCSSCSNRSGMSQAVSGAPSGRQ
jgi:hypothetical protein